MSEDPLKSILARWREAMGGVANIEAVTSCHLKNRVLVTYGNGVQVCGTQDTWYTAEGDFREELSVAGGYYTLTVFNCGQGEGWLVTPDHHIMPLVLPRRSDFIRDDSPAERTDQQPRGATVNKASKPEDIYTQAYIATHSYLVPGRLQGEVEYVGDDTEKGWDIVKLLPRYGEPVMVYLNKTTALPARMEEAGRAGTLLTLGDWQAASGVEYPFVREHPATATAPRKVIKTREVLINPDLPPSLFDKPRDREPIFEFTNGKNSTTVPFEVACNNAFTNVEIAGHGDLCFILDTGTSASIIDLAKAKEFEIPLKCEFKAVLGGGTHPTQVSLIDGVKLKLPGLEYHNHNMMATAFGRLAREQEGRPIVGLLGGTFIKNFVIEIDYEKKTLSVHDPKTFKYTGNGQEIPIQAGSNVPFVKLNLKSCGVECEGNFMVDLGAQMALVLNKPFVDKHPKLRRIAPRIDTVAFGLAGEAKLTAGRLGEMFVGNYDCKGVIIEFAETGKGSTGSDYFDGFLGCEVLRRFRVIFDYPGNRMILEPNAAFNEPYEFDMSGMVLISKGENFERFMVVHVTGDTPASEADIQPGDEVLAIDGRQAAEFTLCQAKEMFREPDKTYLLALRRGDVAFDASISTRRLI